MTDNTKYTYIIPVAPPDFDHAMREAAYQLQRANRLNPPIVNTDGERAIAPRDDCSVAPIPKHGFSGS